MWRPLRRIWSPGCRSPSATVAATVCSEYWGHFLSVGVERCREPSDGISRQAIEKSGKTLKRNGGDDGARTRWPSCTVVDSNRQMSYFQYTKRHQWTRPGQFWTRISYNKLQFHAT